MALARSLGELAVKVGCELIGDPGIVVSRVATLANAGPEAVSFLANRAYLDQLGTTKAAAVVVAPEFSADCPAACLVSDDPYLTYANIATELYPAPAPAPGIHPSAIIDESATVSAHAQISAHVCIGPGSVVDDQVVVGPGTVIGANCHVGYASRLAANVTLVEKVRMGARCIVHSGAVIGSDGFGNAQSDTGWVKVPQVGGVSIGDDVEIGANTTIDCGAIDDTVIEDGVRIDNLVQIAHNVRIGAHTAMAAFSGVSGSTTIGKRCMFAGQAGIVGHIRICDDVVVGGATMISKDITEAGFYTGSFPGEKDRDWKRKVARFRRLDELAGKVRRLERARKDEND